MAVKRTTLNLNEEMLEQARKITGIQEKTALIHAALKQLIARDAARHLIALGGTMPNFTLGKSRSRSR